MCLVFVCDEEERVLGRHMAPGACPYCGGSVQAMDVESQWRFCFLPLCWKSKRKYYCSICSRKLSILLSCGRFTVSKKTPVSSVNVFPHVVDCERVAKEAYMIFPVKGSAWAIYKKSTRSNEEDKRCYDIVVSLTSYSDVYGVSMAYLEKVDGFKTIFKRLDIGSHVILWVEKDGVEIFSYQIPGKKLSGDEAPHLSRGCWELDPASLPAYSHSRI